LLQEAGVSRPYGVTKANGQPVAGVEVHPWRSGHLRLLGLHRNYSLNVGTANDDDSWQQKALQGPLELTLNLISPAALYDTRRGKFLGKQTRWVVTLNDIEPVVLSLLPEPVKGLSAQAPERARSGDLLKVLLQLEGAKLGDTHTFRVQLFGPDGHELSMLTRNLTAPQGRCVWELPLAVNLPKGTYALRFREIATGAQAERPLKVQ
jgi:hypothetical protein